MSELLFDPVEIFQHNLLILYEILKGMSPEEVEKYLRNAQIAPALAQAVRLNLRSEDLTPDISETLEKAGGTDHPDPTLHSSPIAEERSGFKQ